jgi:hypothetical protein
MTMAKIQVTGGAFQDSEGNALDAGTLFLRLNRDGYTDNTFATLVCAGQEVEYLLDSGGNISGTQYAWPNDQILDVWTLVPDTLYMARVENADGLLAWGPNAVYVVGSSFSFTAVAPTNPA